jgi:alpha-tubulin suppressor-like RCC1 family protein
MSKEVFVFGSNSAGQLGCACQDDSVNRPVLNSVLAHIEVANICLTLAQSHIISADGVLLNCGDNEQNELGTIYTMPAILF